MQRRALLLLSLLAAFGSQGCASTLSCTLIGGIDGVSVAIPRSLYVQSGDLHIKVCDEDGCASKIQRLDPIPGGPRPSGRGAVADFDSLGREFPPGQVTVTVTLRGPNNQLVASRHAEVELVRRYPNGKECDGDGYVSGSLKLRANDRVSSGSPRDSPDA